MAAPALVPHPKPQVRLLRLVAKREREEQSKLKRNIDRTANILDRIESRAARLDVQMKRLRQSKEILLRRAEKIETETLIRMQTGGLEKLIGNEHTLAMRANAPSVQVLDQKLIPVEYIRSRLLEEPDKAAIKVALGRGEEIQGVELRQSISLVRT